MEPPLLFEGFAVSGARRRRAHFQRHEATGGLSGILRSPPSRGLEGHSPSARHIPRPSYRPGSAVASRIPAAMSSTPRGRRSGSRGPGWRGGPSTEQLRGNGGPPPRPHHRDPRTLRHSSDSSDTGKGNELTKSFVRCPFSGDLKSLGPLGHVGSTPAPGTNDFSYLERSGG